MKRFGLLSTSAIGSAAFMGLSLAFAAPAYAQDQNNDETCTPDVPAGTVCDTEQEIESGEPATDEQSVLVTGSRIRRPNLESNVPVTSVSAEDLTSQGDVNIGDALNDLPSLRSTFSQANSNRFIGTTGLNLLDLRGLGIERTLVLVNGRRHITSLPGDYIVDVNTIPSDLIERVDVITGGNSAVYGSDAVAGVVNFVLRRDFDGIRLRGQGGVSQQGDRGIQFVSLTAGRNFLDDRANVAVNLEYVNAEALYFIDRPNLTGAVAGRCQFQLTDSNVGEPQSGDGVPDNTFLCGIRNATISNGGTILAANPVIVVGGANTTVACTNATLAPGGANAALGAARCLNPGTAQGVQRIFRFAPGGSLAQDIPTADFRPVGSGNYIGNPNADRGGLGATLRDTGQLAPGLDRYTANVLFNMEVSPAFQPFAEGKYVRIFARQEGQPSFFSPLPVTIGLPNPTCDNAFLDASDRATLQSIGYCTTPTGALPVARFNVDFGGRGDLVERQTWRFVAGVRGDFMDDWNYEVAFNYGHVDIHEDHINDLIIADVDGNLDGFSLAYNPVLVNGVPTCRVNADADPTNNRPDCVPLNLFGAGSPSAAALAFTNTTSFVDQRASEYNAVAFVNGDLSQLFEFPGGPIRFVIGGEWRRETAFLEADPRSAAGGTFFNAFSTFEPPAFEVLEGFGEIELPLLRDMPFAHELTLGAAARYSDYNTSAGTSFAYNLNGTWAPVRDLRFRANYSRSVRVPTQGDLFSNPSQNFAFIADPCDVANIGNGTTNRPLNCAAAGIPVGFINTPARTASTGFLSQGNPFLSEEVGKSLTLGAVFTPRWVPGLSVTVDYYRIRVNNLIAVLGAQVILNQCFDLPDLNNQFCTLLFPRNPDSTFDDPALISGGVNFAQQAADGVDVEVAYRRTFGNGHRLNLRAIATHVLRRTNFTSPTDPEFGNRLLGELGDPQWAGNFTMTYGMGPWDLRYTANYIGSMYVGAYENYNSFQGRPPQNADSAFPNRYPDLIYHSARLSHRVNDRFQFYMGIDNMFDTAPPLGLLGGADGDPYDPVGRYFYAGATVDF